MGGSRSVMNVIKCIRSFSASSNRVWIQPESRFIKRRERRCLRVAATMPGTAAVVSRKMILWSTRYSQRDVLHMLGPLQLTASH